MVCSRISVRELPTVDLFLYGSALSVNDCDWTFPLSIRWSVDNATYQTKKWSWRLGLTPKVDRAFTLVLVFHQCKERMMPGHPRSSLLLMAGIDLLKELRVFLTIQLAWNYADSIASSAGWNSLGGSPQKLSTKPEYWCPPERWRVLGKSKIELERFVS